MQNISGTFTVSIGDQDRTMKATFEAIEKLEQRHGSIMELLDKALNSRLKVSESVYIIYIGLAANGDTRLSYSEVGQYVTDKGLRSVLRVVIEFLTYCLTGGKEGKEDPLEQK